MMDKLVNLSLEESLEWAEAAKAFGSAAERYRKAFQDLPDPGPEEKLEAAKAVTRAYDKLQALRSPYEGKIVMFWAV